MMKEELLGIAIFNNNSGSNLTEQQQPALLYVFILRNLVVRGSGRFARRYCSCMQLPL
jgi:hypothetical protein